MKYRFKKSIAVILMAVMCMTGCGAGTSDTESGGESISGDKDTSEDSGSEESGADSGVVDSGSEETGSDSGAVDSDSDISDSSDDTAAGTAASDTKADATASDAAADTAASDTAADTSADSDATGSYKVADSYVSSNTVPEDESAIRLQFAVEQVIDYMTDEDEIYTYEVQFPQIFLTTDGSYDLDEYTALSSALETLNSSMQTDMHSMDDYMLELVLDDEDAEQMQGMTVYNRCESYIRRADTRVVSIAFLCTSYVGSGGYEYISGVSIDTMTGEEIDLEYVVKDYESISGMIADRLQEIYSDFDFGDSLEDTVLSVLKDSDSMVSYTLEPQTITFYFAPFCLGTEITGRQEISFAYDEVSEYLSGIYTAGDTYPWAVEASAYESMYADIDGDGASDYIYVMGLQNYDGDYVAYDGACIYINDEKTKVDITGYDIECTLIHAADDHYYLYLDTYGDNDYYYIYIYDITGGDVTAVQDGKKFVGTITSEAEYATYDEDSSRYIYSTGYLTNPEYFYLSQRIGLLSVYDAVCTYRVSDGGVPEALSDSFVTATGYELTTLQSVSCDTVDADGNVISTGDTLPSGETVVIYRTDNETYVDLSCDDGSYVRVYVEETEDGVSQCIDGVDVEELFDGMYFAG